MAYASTDTLKKIKARKKAKEVLNHKRREPRKQKLRSDTPKPTRRLNEASARKEPRNFVDDLTRQEEEKAGKGDRKELYKIIRTLAGAEKIPDRPVRAKSGEVLTYQEEQRKRWEEHFREQLNRPPPSEMPGIEPADTPLQVNENRPSKVEIKKAIRRLKNGRAAGSDCIPSEAIKADLNTSTKMLHELFGKIWETDEMPDGWN